MMMMQTLEIAMSPASYIQPCFPPNSSLSFPCKAHVHISNTVKMKTSAKKIQVQSVHTTVVASEESSTFQSSSTGPFNQTLGGQSLPETQDKKNGVGNKRVFFLDVNPLCYEGSKPSLLSFGRWISLYFSEVSHRDPVIAVISSLALFIFFALLFSSLSLCPSMYSNVPIH